MPLTRTLRLARLEQPNPVLHLPVFVVQRLTGREAHEITTEQNAALCLIEANNGGLIPITQEEFTALADGGNLLSVVKANPSSNLRHLFPWDDAEAANLYRQRRMFGGGN